MLEWTNPQPRKWVWVVMELVSPCHWDYLPSGKRWSQLSYALVRGAAISPWWGGPALLLHHPKKSTPSDGPRPELSMANRFQHAYGLWTSTQTQKWPLAAAWAQMSPLPHWQCRPPRSVWPWWPHGPETLMWSQMADQTPDICTALIGNTNYRHQLRPLAAAWDPMSPWLHVANRSLMSACFSPPSLLQFCFFPFLFCFFTVYLLIIRAPPQPESQDAWWACGYV